MKKTAKHILIAAGGTGGHLFPAQALAGHLKEKETNYSVLFMGKGLSSNKFFRKDLFPYKDVPAAPFSSKNFIKTLGTLIKGTYQALRMLTKFQPSLVVGFGSFHSFPVLFAALLKGVPIALFESNSIAGRVNRLFSRFASFSAVQFSSAKQHLKGQCFEVEVPFWRFQDDHRVSKEEALAYFSLLPDVYTLLVFGGSQGARFINTVFLDTLEAMGEKAKTLQVIHLTGDAGSQADALKFYQEKGIVACVKPFEENMHFAWSLADGAICRSGAATLSELIQFEIPSILIPYPYATDQHQLKNALFIEEIGGGFCLEEKNICAKNLLPLIEQFMGHSNDIVQTMKESIHQFKQKRKTVALSDLVEQFIKKTEL